MSRPTVLVIGDIMIDVIVDAPSDLVRGSDVPSTIATNFGGTGMNVAMWARQPDLEVQLLGAVGSDGWGNLVLDRLALAGVSSIIEQSPTLPTGIVVALAHRDGERSFFPDFRANAAVTSISPDSLDWQYVKVLVVSGYSLINLATRSWAESMLQAAVARNVATVVDPASSAPLADVPTDVLQRWFDLADYVIPNEQEFELLRARAALPERSVVIEKRGAAGVRLVRNNHTVQEFAAEAAHVIDTIGAGDAFVGGFAAYLATDHSLEDSILAGLHTARQAVEIRGAQPAE